MTESCPGYYSSAGRARIRVRETYLRDQVGPMLASRASGAVKVDLLLRGLASLDTGLVDPEVSWESMHDLVRPGDYYRDETRLKRNWIGEKLARLEKVGLLSRSKSPGGRTRLRVLRDDGTGAPLDDPGASGAAYVTALGDLLEHRRIGSWGGAELSAYFAAMIAERYGRSEQTIAHLSDGRDLGGGLWFRELKWFADAAGNRPPNHVRIAFPERTLRRGFVSLRQQGLVASLRIYHDPRSGKPFKNSYGRYLYLNGFNDARPGRGVRSQDLAVFAKRFRLAAPRTGGVSWAARDDRE